MKNLNINSGNAKLRGTNIDQIKLASEAGNSNVGRLCITFKDGTKRSYKITLRNSSRTVSEEALSNFITKVIIHNQANFKARKSIDFDKKSGSSVIKKTVDSREITVINQVVEQSFRTLAKIPVVSSTVDGDSTSLPLPDPTGADHHSVHTSAPDLALDTVSVGKDPLERESNLIYQRAAAALPDGQFENNFLRQNVLYIESFLEELYTRAVTQDHLTPQELLEFKTKLIKLRDDALSNIFNSTPGQGGLFKLECLGAFDNVEDMIQAAMVNPSPPQAKSLFSRAQKSRSSDNIGDVCKELSKRMKTLLYTAIDEYQS